MSACKASPAWDGDSPAFAVPVTEPRPQPHFGSQDLAGKDTTLAVGTEKR